MCCCSSVSFEGEWDSILSFPSSSPLFCLVLSAVSWILAGAIALAAWIKLVKNCDLDEDREEDKVMDSEVVRRGEFLLHSEAGSPPVSVTLTSSDLQIRRLRQTAPSCFSLGRRRRQGVIRVPFEDILGCEVQNESGKHAEQQTERGSTSARVAPLLFSEEEEEEDTLHESGLDRRAWLDTSGDKGGDALLAVHYREFRGGKDGPGGEREVRKGTAVLRAEEGGTEDKGQNLVTVRKWCAALRRELALRRRRLSEEEEEDACTSRPLDRRRRMLVFVNPKSGAGKAGKIYEEVLAPALRQAGIQHDLVTTKRCNHAHDLVCSESDFSSRWSCVVVVSGDGLLFEVLQGVFRREDWREARKVPLAILAGGSGNGLARSLAFESGNKYVENGVLAASLSLAAEGGRSRPMDLVRVETGSGRVMYSFLSIGTGFLSDCDIESERLRWLGEPRFALWAVYRLAFFRSYRATVTYLPHGGREAPAAGGGGAKSSKYIPTSSSSAEGGGGDDIGFDRQITERTLAGGGDGRWTESPEYADATGREVHSPEPDALTLPTISEPIPLEEGWVRDEDDFVIVYALNASFIGADLKAAPAARTDDGRIWLLLVRKGVSRAQMFRILNNFESGNHVNLPGVEMIPVRAFRLEPQATQAKDGTPSREGFLTVDGELVDYGPLQAEVLSSFVNIVA